ncbi:MAG TPA: hypothetical protein VMV69_17650 [Pirellulales bacterium]|nr:hypothetical protein [Pirellulales bacterium]
MTELLQSHPDLDQLRAFSLGRLDDEAASMRVSAHLDTCADCRRTLETVSGDTLEQLVRSAETSVPEAVPAPEPPPTLRDHARYQIDGISDCGLRISDCGLRIGGGRASGECSSAPRPEFLAGTLRVPSPAAPSRCCPRPPGRPTDVLTRRLANSRFQPNRGCDHRFGPRLRHTECAYYYADQPAVVAIVADDFTLRLRDSWIVV